MSTLVDLAGNPAKRYVILTNWDSRGHLELEVSTYLAAGWQIAGGPVFMRVDNESGWAQALWREIP